MLAQSMDWEVLVTESPRMLSFWINYVVAVQPRKWATEIGLALRYDLISVKPNRLAGRAQKLLSTGIAAWLRRKQQYKKPSYYVKFALSQPLCRLVDEAICRTATLTRRGANKQKRKRTTRRKNVSQSTGIPLSDLWTAGGSKPDEIFGSA